MIGTTNICNLDGLNKLFVATEVSEEQSVVKARKKIISFLLGGLDLQ